MREATAQVKIYVCLVIKWQKQLPCLLITDYYRHMVNWYCNWQPPLSTKTPPLLHPFIRGWVRCWQHGPLLKSLLFQTFSRCWSSTQLFAAILLRIPSDLATNPKDSLPQEGGWKHAAEYCVKNESKMWTCLQNMSNFFRSCYLNQQFCKFQ